MNPLPIVDKYHAAYLTAIDRIVVLERRNAALVEALKDANDLCRSAYQIALRDGERTNWQYFRDRMAESLDRQHLAMLAANKEPT